MSTIDYYLSTVLMAVERMYKSVMGWGWWASELFRMSGRLEFHEYVIVSLPQTE